MNMRIDSVAQSAIREALSDLGFKIEKEEMAAADRDVDLLARKGPERYAIEVKAQAPFRREQFRGAVADSILRLKFVQKVHPWKPLLCFWLDKASPKAVSELREYVQKHARQFNWLLVDASGWRKWQIDKREGELLRAWHSQLNPWQAPERAPHPFSPRYQWMLKLLLLPGLDKHYWRGPEERPLNAKGLARSANVSQSHVSNFLSALESFDYLRRDNKQFRFPHIQRLLDDWSSALRFRSGKIFQAKPLYPQVSPDDALRELLKSLSEEGVDPRRYPEGAVLSSHYACHLLGLGYSNVKSLRLYVGVVPNILERLNLVKANPGEGSWEIVVPRARDAVFGGRVHVGNLMVCDVLQCYLDVRSSPARGSEQAEFVFEKVLEPHFRKAGWL
jgi:hypothetical protein